MITHQTSVDAIQKIPESYLDELFAIIKNFEAKKLEKNGASSAMAKLRKIHISAPSDFSQTAELSNPIDKK